MATQIVNKRNRSSVNLAGTCSYYLYILYGKKLVQALHWHWFAAIWFTACLQILHLNSICWKGEVNFLDQTGHRQNIDIFGYVYRAKIKIIDNSAVYCMCPHTVIEHVVLHSYGVCSAMGRPIYCIFTVVQFPS